MQQEVPEPDPVSRALIWDVQEAYEDQDYIHALTLLDSLLQRLPDYAQLHNLRARVLSSLYRFDEAEAAYAQARKLAPNLKGVAYAMGSNAFFRGQFRSALNHYQSEIALLSSDDTTALGAVWAQIGRVYARLGVDDSARIAYKRALSHRPSYAQAWSWLAELDEDLGALEEALVNALRAVSLMPNEAEFNYLAGSLSVRTGRAADAEPHLDAVLQTEPWHVGANYNMARCLLALGRTAEAHRFFEATERLEGLQADIILARFVLERNPLGVQEWLTLADLYQMSGRVQEAREAYGIARQLN